MLEMKSWCNTENQSIIPIDAGKDFDKLQYEFIKKQTHTNIIQEQKGMSLI